MKIMVQSFSIHAHELRLEPLFQKRYRKTIFPDNAVLAR